jgi:hypothetical protein
MSQAKYTFKKRELSRMIRAAVKAGTPPQSVELDRDGKITVTIASAEPQPPDGEIAA